jgi:xanthine/uracil/vitamin C permease (AzgA family)
MRDPASAGKNNCLSDGSQACRQAGITQIASKKLSVMMPFSFSITEGIAFGFISYSLLKTVSGKAKEVSGLVYIFSLLFLLRYIFLK